MRKKYKRKTGIKGMTLVETIVSLALLTVIITIAVSLITAGQKMFKKGSSRAKIQHDIQMAADFISKELRNATWLEIGAEEDGLSDVYYIDVEDGRIRYRTREGADVYKTEKIFKDGDKLEFFIKEVDEGGTGDNIRYLLGFEISVVNENKELSVESSVLLNNIPDEDGISNVGPGDSVYFTKKEDVFTSP